MSVRNSLRRAGWDVNIKKLLQVPSPSLTIDEVQCPNGHDDVYFYELDEHTARVGCENCDEKVTMSVTGGEL